MVSRAPLPFSEVRTALADLDGWWQDHSRLLRGLRLPDQPSAIALLTRIGAVAEELDHHPDVDLRHRDLWITSTTHSSGAVSGKDLELAARIDELAREAGAESLPVSVASTQIGIDVVDAAAVAPFWVAVTGYRESVDHEGDVHLHDPADRGPDIWFQPMDPPRTGRGRTHLDVYVDAGSAAHRVQTALDAGGVLVTAEFAPAWWVLADTEGNEVCVCTVGL